VAASERLPTVQRCGCRVQGLVRLGVKLRLASGRVQAGMPLSCQRISFVQRQIHSVTSPDSVDDRLCRPAHPHRIPIGEAGHHLPTPHREELRSVKANVTDGHRCSWSTLVLHPGALVIQAPGKVSAARNKHVIAHKVGDLTEGYTV
jgi:hypothetical protein